MALSWIIKNTAKKMIIRDKNAAKSMAHHLQNTSRHAAVMNVCFASTACFVCSR